ncbi:MAG: YkgJ family cysteine cluster protein [Polyangiaceae bacterium]
MPSKLEEPLEAMEFDCLSCGACCRDIADGTALVSEDDLVRWKRDKADHILASLVPGHFSQMGFGTHPGTGTCLHLGTKENANACSIYETRGWACHALEPGSAQCRTYREVVFAREGRDKSGSPRT